MEKKNISKANLFYTALSFFSLWILLKTYYYLNKLENCDCYNNAQAYNNLKTDIEFLKAYQIFEMFLVFMFILIRSCKHRITAPNKNTFQFTLLSSSVILLMAFVTGYISYNVFLLYSISKVKCKCLDKWQKYFIYVQGIMGSITFLRLLFMLVVAFILLFTTCDHV
jgi:hypothetical protein